MIGELVLIAGEDMHREVPCIHERIEAGRRSRDAPQHHRRVERYRVEAVGRHADIAAVGVDRGDDGDAGGEAAKRLSKLFRVEISQIGTAWGRERVCQYGWISGVGGTLKKKK